MSQNNIFIESFFIAGIMCFDGCGNKIHEILRQCIHSRILENQAIVSINSEPDDIGIHKFTITIQSANENDITQEVITEIKEEINSTINKAGFSILDTQKNVDGHFIDHKNQKKYKRNIFINCIVMSAIIALYFIFPPSIILTAILTAISFIATIFTSKEYLLAFFKNFRTKSFANMATTVSLGVLLSIAHTIFHVVGMPFVMDFAMLFMSFIMPPLLITCINMMDEIKRYIAAKASNAKLKGMRSLFPEMAEHYLCYKLPIDHIQMLETANKALSANACEEDAAKIRKVFQDNNIVISKNDIEEKSRSLIKENDLVLVKRGESFPVDSFIIEGSTCIDASIITGEPYQIKNAWELIPAGAINLGEDVIVYAVKNPYNSAINKVLFPANRAYNTQTTRTSKFIYAYIGIIAIGLLLAIILPFVLSIASVALLMQNILGILFFVCPCTIAIAHKLPELISLHHRSAKGIYFRDAKALENIDDKIHTIVFDKTGTLTTGEPEVESATAFTQDLMAKIYLLEKNYGRGHPLAKAIVNYYKTHDFNTSDVNTNNYIQDLQNRGFQASINNINIHIGSYAYLEENGIRNIPAPDEDKISQGCSAVYIAENNEYKGVIYIKHTIRPETLEVLQSLKKSGKNIIMLTGDNPHAAKAFNIQLASIFAEANIHAGQTPQDKERFLKSLWDKSPNKARGIWFVGDGLNDALCCRSISENGGVSWAIHGKGPARFFTNATLNSSLDYLLIHDRLNRFLHNTIAQNKAIIIYNTLIFLGFLVGFAIAGISVSPLIPMAIMLSTTFLVIFNAYRNKLNIDCLLDTTSPKYKKILSSNFAIGLLIMASTLLVSATLIATINTGALLLPLASFTSGMALAASSACALTSIVLLVLFASVVIGSWLTKYSSKNNEIIYNMDARIG